MGGEGERERGREGGGWRELMGGGSEGVERKREGEREKKEGRG